MIDYGGSTDETYGPKIGEEKTIKLISSERIEEENGERNFKSTKENYGFHYIMHLENGKKMYLNTFALFYAMKEANIQDGDTFTIKHPARGEYITEKVTEEKSSVESAW